MLFQSTVFIFTTMFLTFVSLVVVIIFWKGNRIVTDAAFLTKSQSKIQSFASLWRFFRLTIIIRLDNGLTRAVQVMRVWSHDGIRIIDQKRKGHVDILLHRVGRNSSQDVVHVIPSELRRNAKEFVPDWRLSIASIAIGASPTVKTLASSRVPIPDTVIAVHGSGPQSIEPVMTKLFHKVVFIIFQLIADISEAVSWTDRSLIIGEEQGSEIGVIGSVHIGRSHLNLARFQQDLSAIERFRQHGRNASSHHRVQAGGDPLMSQFSKRISTLMLLHPLEPSVSAELIFFGSHGPRVKVVTLAENGVSDPVFIRKSASSRAEVGITSLVGRNANAATFKTFSDQAIPVQKGTVQRGSWQASALEALIWSSTLIIVCVTGLAFVNGVTNAGATLLIAPSSGARSVPFFASLIFCGNAFAVHSRAVSVQDTLIKWIASLGNWGEPIDALSSSVAGLIVDTLRIFLVDTQSGAGIISWKRDFSDAENWITYQVHAGRHSLRFDGKPEAARSHSAASSHAKRVIQLAR